MDVINTCRTLSSEYQDQDQDQDNMTSSKSCLRQCGDDMRKKLLDFLYSFFQKHRKGGVPDRLSMMAFLATMCKYFQKVISAFPPRRTSPKSAIFFQIVFPWLRDNTSPDKNMYGSRCFYFQFWLSFFGTCLH